MRLRILDLFSGIGGFSLGLERTGGFETAGFCEIDPFCRRVLAAHWPDVPCHDDVRTMQFTEGMADVITAGFPCQDVSYAGAGAGLAGERSGLYREVVRAIRMVRPVHAILENVAALLGRGMGTVLGDLAEIGYDAEWHCIPASVVGAPHRRDRIWIVAYPGGEQHEGCRAPISGQIAAELSFGVADSASLHGQEVIRREPDGNYAGSEEVANAGGASLWGGLCQKEKIRGRRRSSNSRCEVAHGVPSRVDRLKALGNAVVPQIPEIIGRAILATRGKC